MSNLLNSEDFGLKLYNRFPPTYLEEDAKVKFALKRYLQSLSDGGFKFIIDDSNGLIDLIDFQQTRPEVLPLLLEQFGLEVFHGIPEEFLRIIIPQMGKIWETKGTMKSIEFFTTLLSGIQTSIEFEYDEKDDLSLNIVLEMDYSVGDYVPDVERFNRLIDNVVPFYVDHDVIFRYYFECFATVKMQENLAYDIIHDNPKEHGRFFYKGVFDPNNIEPIFAHYIFGGTTFNSPNRQEDLADVFEDNIVYTISEAPKISCAEYTEDISPSIIVEEAGKPSVVESAKSKVGYMTEESSVFSIATFGESKFNELKYDYVTIDY